MHLSTLISRSHRPVAIINPLFLTLRHTSHGLIELRNSERIIDIAVLWSDLGEDFASFIVLIIVD
jgi:hypothetical protein